MINVAIKGHPLHPAFFYFLWLFPGHPTDKARQVWGGGERNNLVGLHTRIFDHAEQNCIYLCQGKVSVNEHTGDADRCRYDHLSPDEKPDTESLATTLKRVLPYWEKVIGPDIKAGKNVLVRY